MAHVGALRAREPTEGYSTPHPATHPIGPAEGVLWVNYAALVGGDLGVVLQHRGWQAGGFGAGAGAQCAAPATATRRASDQMLGCGTAHLNDDHPRTIPLVDCLPNVVVVVISGPAVTWSGACLRRCRARMRSRWQLQQGGRLGSCVCTQPCCSRTLTHRWTAGRTRRAPCTWQTAG